MMVRNLEERECPLLGIHSVPDTAAQEARFVNNGWDGACSTDMLSVWTAIPQDERVIFLLVLPLTFVSSYDMQ